MSPELAGWGWSPVRCPRCGQENPDEARFCLHCGAQLAISCPGCGAVQPPGARFCPECGRAVGAAPGPAGYTPAHVSDQILAVRGAAKAREDLWWLPEVMRMRAAYDEKQAAISRLRSAAVLASAHGSVALLRRCEHDLAGHGLTPTARHPTT